MKVIVARTPAEAIQWASDHEISRCRIALDPSEVRGISRGSEVRVLGYPGGTGDEFASELGVLAACGVQVQYGPS